jgi:hypothetical protein
MYNLVNLVVSHEDLLHLLSLGMAHDLPPVEFHFAQTRVRTSSEGGDLSVHSFAVQDGSASPSTL